MRHVWTMGTNPRQPDLTQRVASSHSADALPRQRHSGWTRSMGGEVKGRLARANATVHHAAQGQRHPAQELPT